MEKCKKALKIQDKYEKKLKIIEENTKLTEQEKQKVYKKLQKQINKHKKTNDNLIKLANLTYHVSSSIACEEPFHNFALGWISAVTLITGVVGLLSGIVNTSALGTTIHAIAVAYGSIVLPNVIVNTEINGESILNTQITNVLDKRKDINKVFDIVNSKLDTLIKTPELEMGN